MHAHAMPTEPTELVNRFVSAVQSQNDCIRAHNPERGNQFAAVYAEAGRALLSAGKSAIDAFAEQLSHDDWGVRVMAGAYLLKARTEEVVAALEPISRGKGLAAFGSHVTLERYDRGELTLEP